MKKRLFAAIGATGVATMLIFTLTFSSDTSNASQLSKNNLAAFKKVAEFGKCTGPKPQGGNCESSNDHKCSDNDNCSSSTEETN